ncbi:hypothetical protein [Actinomadura sp. 9N407]|uniref:hypothetical protein n=1 Tax=Actinomadura sp. 9N407 TaxID=3375154 RepID=UPI00378907EF
MDFDALKTSGSKFLRSALTHWCNDFSVLTVLHAGIGCEHLLKAYLTSFNVLLIADSRDRALKYEAIGRGDAAPAPLTQAKTIGAAEAFVVAERLMSGRMQINMREFEIVLSARNGVAHSAYHDVTTTANTLALAVKLTESLRTEMSISSREFWQEYEGLQGDLELLRESYINRHTKGETAHHNLRGNEPSEGKTSSRQSESEVNAEATTTMELESKAFAVAKVASVKIAYAKRIYQARHGKRSAARVQALVEPDNGELEGFTTRRACPSCGYQAFLTVKSELRFCSCQGRCNHRDRQLEKIIPTRFQCLACSLESIEGEEIIAFGFTEPSDHLYYADCSICEADASVLGTHITEQTQEGPITYGYPERIFCWECGEHVQDPVRMNQEFRVDTKQRVNIFY